MWLVGVFWGAGKEPDEPQEGGAQVLRPGSGLVWRFGSSLGPAQDQGEESEALRAQDIRRRSLPGLSQGRADV